MPEKTELDIGRGAGFWAPLPISWSSRSVDLELLILDAPDFVLDA